MDAAASETRIKGRIFSLISLPFSSAAAARATEFTLVQTQNEWKKNFCNFFFYMFFYPLLLQFYDLIFSSSFAIHGEENTLI